jgi:hypothetical protein
VGRCSLGADFGQGAKNIGAIAADEIVAGAFGRARSHKEAGAVPRGGRMGKPEDRPHLSYVKACITVVGGRAIDGQNGRATCDFYAVAILVRRDMVEGASGRLRT